MKKHNHKKKICKICNKEYFPTGSNQKVCKKCKPIQIKRTNEKYFKSERWKIAKKQRRNTINGRIETAFDHIKARCNNPNCHAYHRYGGRGIKNKFKSNQEFRNYVVNELQIDPRGLEIHRVNNNGHYEPGNIEFISPNKHQKKHSKRVRTK